MRPILKGFEAMNTGIKLFVSRRPYLHRYIMFIDDTYFIRNKVNNTKNSQLWSH
jgi:hypothetical protein